MKKKFGYNLEQIVNRSDQIQQVTKNNLSIGDIVIAKTRNSSYKLQKVEENLFEVTGGWFDQKGLSPKVMTVRGCTRGGSII